MLYVLQCRLDDQNGLNWWPQSQRVKQRLNKKGVNNKLFTPFYSTTRKYYCN